MGGTKQEERERDSEGLWNKWWMSRNWISPFSSFTPIKLHDVLIAQPDAQLSSLLSLSVEIAQWGFHICFAFIFLLLCLTFSCVTSFNCNFLYSFFSFFFLVEKCTVISSIAIILFLHVLIQSVISLPLFLCATFGLALLLYVCFCVDSFEFSPRFTAIILRAFCHLKKNVFLFTLKETSF